MNVETDCCSASIIMTTANNQIGTWNISLFFWYLILILIYEYLDIDPIINFDNQSTKRRIRQTSLVRTTKLDSRVSEYENGVLDCARYKYGFELDSFNIIGGN